MVRKSGVTLYDLLRLECMKHVRVLAGTSGLSRIVTNVNVMEVPDIGEWINPGDLLLTTAYSIRNNPTALTCLVPTLADKGLAGLMLKPKRYLQTIPQQMLEQADSLNFPLLELPAETSFSEIMNPILSEILEIQTHYFQKSEQAHRLFTEVILTGGRLEDIANTLAGLIDNSVLITDSEEKILAKSPIPPEVDWEYLCNSKPKQKKLVDPLESGLKYYRSKLKDKPPLHEYKTSIIAKGQVRGYLVIWDNNRPLTSNDFIFIDRAMTVAALEFLNTASLTEIERRYRNEFLDALLSESVQDSKGLVERARHLGWDLAKNYVAMLMDIDQSTPAPNRKKQKQNQFQQTKERLFSDLLLSLREPGEQFIAGSKSDRIILLLAPPPGCTNLQAYFMGRAEEILQSLTPSTRNYAITLGVGRFYPGISGLRKSYNEALKAVNIGNNLFGANKVVHFNQLGVYRLLHAIKDRNELVTFYQETIQPLDQHDEDYKSEFVPTLEAYFQCNCNLKQVAKLLYIHYNTILYRIERISEITGLDLKCPEQRLNLQLGLKIRKIHLDLEEKC